MLLPAGSESHSYEPTPQDIKKIANCDVFIYVGGDSDAWVTDILTSIDTDKIKVITLMDCVELVEEELKEGMTPEAEEAESPESGVEEHEYDEHVWTSPRNAVKIVDKIAAALDEKDAANAAAYKANAAAYNVELMELDAWLPGGEAPTRQAQLTEMLGRAMEDGARAQTTRKSESGRSIAATVSCWSSATTRSSGDRPASSAPA